MAYEQKTMTIEWIEANIPIPIPMSDKTRLHEMLDILSHEDKTIPEKEGALKALGTMSLRYGAFFLIMCGVIPLLKQYLLSDKKQLSMATARTIKFVAQSGGIEELIQDGIDEDLKTIIKDINKDFDVRDMCATAYGWIISCPLTEIKPDIIY